MTEQDKVTVDDIIGIVKTEEQTNSVEEVRKLRGRENKTAKRFIIMDNVPAGTHSSIWDKQKQHNQGIGDELWLGEVVGMTDDMERYYYWKEGNWEQISDECTTNNFYTLEQCANELNRLNEENEQLKTTIQQLRTDNTKQKKKLNTAMKENEQLKIALKDKENLISICEKKFKELGYLITCDDDGYTVEKI